jgi:excisionase family DNA binding protein
MTDDGPLLIPVPEAARRLGVGRDSAWRMIHDGTIPAARIGRRVLVPAQALPEVARRLAGLDGAEANQALAPSDRRTDPPGGP